MKILITGGAGFIASQVAERYLKEGHQVVIVDDLSSGIPENLPPKSCFYHMSITHPHFLNIVKEEMPDIINHHAAQIDVRKSVAAPLVDATVNILGSLNVLESCRKFGVKKIIFASSGGAIYGEQETFPASETHRTDPKNPYGITKLCVEKYIQFYSEAYHIPYSILRYANVYGPRQGIMGDAGVVAIFIKKILKGETPIIYGDGHQTRDFVFVEDVIDCNVEALDLEAHGIFNVGSSIETDIMTLALMLIRLCEVDTIPLFASPRLGEQLRSCLKPGTLQKRPPTPLILGLQKTLEWFRIREDHHFSFSGTNN